MEEVLVIDIGGTKTNVSLVTSIEKETKILSSNMFLTDSYPENTIERINSIFSNGNRKIKNMSLSLPGVWDESGLLKESHFLHDWLDYPFVKNLTDKLSIKNCIWETDVICAALGEYNSLVETHGHASLLYINLGTGIGAALIKDGKPYKNNSKLGLRMQKLVLPFEDEIYSGVDLICGGTLTEISGYDSIQALYHDYKLANVEALDMLSRAQVQLSAWIINLFYLFAPDVIVLGGGLTYDWEVLAESAVDIANEELEGQVKILPSKLKELAPIYGAYFNYCQQAKLK